MNKYLVTIIVPALEMNFEMYIPNNKKVGTIKTYILKSINEITSGQFNADVNNISIIDRASCKEYLNNSYIKDTDIKNGTKLIFM
ncbi:MAG: hypothetical protein IKN87_00185 [Bacilli bacterium]|nr:hypothetical protein [Bacilli bacterium]